MKTTIMSLGGSLIVPDKVDYSFLRKFKKVILPSARKSRFVIFCGGGKLARDYQKALSELINAPKEALDWMGIHATRINAESVREIFGNDADEKILTDPTKRIASKKRIIIAAGWKPGWSTDYDAVLVAKQLKVREMINMSNVDFVYSADPKKSKSAKPLKEISWKNLRKLVGSKWSPGLNMPFDPIAAKQAERQKLLVYVIGRDLNNLQNVLIHKPFKGTLIR
ncbi:MAG TPA: UMP kinase [Candidatus Nanoarchaeia archaeon]|nr:UMP kinase [Candidatus Nanoarchaeia archaeon]